MIDSWTQPEFGWVCIWAGTQDYPVVTLHSRYVTLPFRGNASTIFICDSVLRNKHKLGNNHRDKPNLVLWWYHLVFAAFTEPLSAKVRNSEAKCTEKHRMIPLTESEWDSVPVRGRQQLIVEPTGLQLGVYYPSHPLLMDTMSLLASHYCLNYRQC